MTPDLSHDTVVKAEQLYMLRFWTEAGWQVNLEGDLTLTSPGGDPQAVDHSGISDTIPQELAWIVGARIERFEALEDGTMVLDFGGRVLTCAAHPTYESWQLYGPRGEIVVCGPGGRFTEWGPRRDEP